MSTIIDRFADVRILRYEVPGFAQLPLQQKEMLYYLSEAALWGRDILWHQNDAHALEVRRTLECIYAFQLRQGITPDARFEEYLKRIWFANGLHHHYSNDKFQPQFTSAELLQWAQQVPVDVFLAQTGRTAESAVASIESIVFDASVNPKKVCLDENCDLVRSSSVNFYDGVTQSEVEQLYADGNGTNAINSQVVKLPDGTISEQVWKLHGMYGAAIEKIIFWLGRAAETACNDTQANVIRALIHYYETGSLTDFDQYNILWVADKSSPIDFINGFIEVYSDPLGLKGTWESIVELVDSEASERIRLISENAQWFEDHSPVDTQYRKRDVQGVSMNVISAVMLGGDCYPSTPIGVNLPNADWIREQHGSKSITLSNITHAYHEAAKGSGVLAEFASSAESMAREEQYGRLADDLHTQLHECLGHGSGQMADGVSLDDLKAYGSTIEEARADLYALYFMADDKMQQIGVAPSKDVAWAHYDAYLRSGLIVQLARIAEGKNIEESHMRNRHLISSWVLERAQPLHAAAMVERNGKHYVEIYDYEALRGLFGELLREVQRIKSEGDYDAARALVEGYGVRIDAALHSEVRRRYEALGVAPFSGFVNPRLTPVMADGRLVDITIDYTETYTEQMLRYSAQYSPLR